MKESIKVLQECAELQAKKGNDYQNPNSRIQQADYYPQGVANAFRLLFMLKCFVCDQLSKQCKTILTMILTSNQSKILQKI